MEKFDLMEIEKIETGRFVKNLDWFYHGFDFGNITAILNKGILAKKYLDFPTPNFGLNGKHYISVSKDMNVSGGAFNRYKQSGPLMILDNIKALKCKYKKLYYPFRLTAFPFRYTEWTDEYQVYSKILPDKFVGIECMVYDWTKENNLFLLKRFRSMLEVMQSLGVKLPIYDFSREDSCVIHEVDQEAFLELSKCLTKDSLLL